MVLVGALTCSTCSQIAFTEAKKSSVFVNNEELSSKLVPAVEGPDNQYIEKEEKIVVQVRMIFGKGVLIYEAINNEQTHLVLLTMLLYLVFVCNANTHNF